MGNSEKLKNNQQPLRINNISEKSFRHRKFSIKNCEATLQTICQSHFRVGLFTDFLAKLFS